MEVESRETKRLEMLKQLLGMTDSSKEPLVAFALENAEETVRNYCHIEEIPEGLNSTVVRMAMELYRNERPGEEGVPLTVTSIKAGDTSSSFGIVENMGYTGSVLKNYKNQLHRYSKAEF